MEEGACLFLLRNSILRLAFLLRVEGLSFFLSTGCGANALLLVSKEKEKEVPMAMEMLKVCPCLASAWQKSRHLESRGGESTSSSPAILALLLN